MKKIAVISAILEEPKKCQQQFNEVVSVYSDIIKGRMGLPFETEGISIICIAVSGELDKINAMTGKLGNIEHVSVKTSISRKEMKE